MKTLKKTKKGDENNMRSPLGILYYSACNGSAHKSLEVSVMQ
jgi:hypothetical protein